MTLPNYATGAIDDVTVLINGVPATSTQYRLTSYGVKVKVGSTGTDVEVRYTNVLTWEQTDWAGGAGQATWSDPTRYDFASGVDTSMPGQVHLADTAGAFVTSGTLLSSVYNGTVGVQWLSLDWSATVPALTGFRVQVRSGDTPETLGAWSSWITTPGTSLAAQSGRYIQYQIELSTSDTGVTPVLSDIHFHYVPGPGIHLTQLAPLSGDSQTVIDVSAHLSDDDAQPVIGQSVRFRVDDLAPVSGTTDSMGHASASLYLDLAPGSYTLVTEFDGTVSYAPTTTSQPLSVTAPWDNWIQDSQEDFNLNPSIPTCLDLATVPGSVRLTGHVVGVAEESGPYTLGVGEETGPFTLGTQEGYGYRNRLQVHNPNGTTLPAGYTLKLVLDTQGLINAGKLLANGNDLRIARDTGSGFAELDRQIDSGFPGTSTQIIFKLQSSIAAGGDDTSYYIYYGNPSVGSPPTNPANIYWLWDEFNGTSIDTGRWSPLGSVTVADGIAYLPTGADLLSVASTTYGILDARLRAGNTSNVVFWGWEDGRINAPHFIVYQQYPPLRGAILNVTSISRDLTNPPVTTDWHEYSVRWIPGQVDWSVDGVLQATYSGTSPAVPNVTMNANFNAYLNTMEIDWIRGRLYATNEPTISLITAASYQYRRAVWVENTSPGTLPSGTAVKLTMDTASLTSAGKLLANGNDLRLVWMNGATPVELDRVADTAFNSPSTVIWFKTQAAILPATLDDDYYIFYGNPSTPPPLANPGNIFPFWDGFDGLALDTALWTPNGSVSVSSGEAHIATTSRIFSKTSLTYGALEMRIKAANESNVMFWGWEETPADANNILVFQEQPSPNFFNAIYRQGGGTWNQPVINDSTWRFHHLAYLWC